MREKRWVVCVGCGPKQAPLMEAAKVSGYYIIGIDRKPDCDLIDIAIPISTYAKEDVLLELGAQGGYPKFDGVLCRSSGPAVETAFAVANLNGLLSSGRLVVECSLSKWKLFNWSIANRIPTIPSIRCNSCTKAPREWKRTVVKPAEPVYGKKNVFLVDNTVQMKFAIEEACKESLDGHCLMQPYIQGEDIGLIALSRKGKLLWSSFYQECTTFKEGAVNANGVRSLHNRFEDSLKSKIQLYAEKMIRKTQASGFTFFTFRCSQSGCPMLYEVNPGLCGDFLADKLLPAMWPGVNFFELDVATMTGQKVTVPQGPPLSVRIVDGKVYRG